MFIILFIMAFDSIYSMPKAWKTSSETIWKRDELIEFAEYGWVRNELEKQEWFFCSSTSLWYMQTYYLGLTDQFYWHEEFD